MDVCRPKIDVNAILIASTSNVGGLQTLRGSRKSVYNLFMGSFGPILVPTWRHLDPTWTQLGINSSQYVKINTKVIPK